jgi:hypothetical protein
MPRPHAPLPYLNNPLNPTASQHVDFPKKNLQQNPVSLSYDIRQLAIT